MEEDSALVGAPTDPERFGHDELLKREVTDPGIGATQYQLNCRLAANIRSDWVI